MGWTAQWDTLNPLTKSIGICFDLKSIYLLIYLFLLLALNSSSYSRPGARGKSRPILVIGPGRSLSDRSSRGNNNRNSRIDRSSRSNDSRRVTPASWGRGQNE